MEKLLYDRSIVWMRMLLPYKQKWITEAMQVLSVIGDGHIAFELMVALIYARGRKYEFTLMSTCYFLNMHWINFLKIFIRGSRPQFDDPTIAEENHGDCAGEFGNPSGHVLTNTFVCYAHLMLYREVCADFLQRHKWFSRCLDITVPLFCILMGFNRLYLGRHTVDQILLGLVVGYVKAHFLIYCFKPYMYDPSFKP